MICIIDIDGTCADAAARFAAAGPEPLGRGPDYWEWLARVQTPESLAADAPVRGMVELVRSVAASKNIYTFYLTGREDVHREVTEQWLDKWGFPSALVIMRPTGNVQSNGEFKEATIKDLATDPSAPVLVIDDDHTGEIEAVCKVNSWTFLKARSGS